MGTVRTSARAIIQRDDRLLVIRYQDDRGAWYALPGGGQQHGESLEATLRREVEEETGARVRVGPLRFVRESLATSESRGLPPEWHQVELIFACEILSPCDDGRAPDPAQTAAEWRTVAELRELVFFPGALLDALEYRTEATYLGVV